VYKTENASSQHPQQAGLIKRRSTLYVPFHAGEEYENDFGLLTLEVVSPNKRSISICDQPPTAP